MVQNYLKIALRHLRSHAMVSVLNIMGLATGICICLFTGLWVKRELGFDTFHPDADRIFRLSNTFKSETESFSQAPCGPAFGAHLSQEIAGITSAVRYSDASERLEYGEKRFFEKNALFADTNFFKFFRFPLLRGEAGQVLQPSNSIVLTQKAASKYFGDEDPVGKTMLFAGKRPMTVTGVAANPPDNSQVQFEMVMPLAVLKKMAAEDWGMTSDVDDEWLGGWMMTFVKLSKPAEKTAIETRINELLQARAKTQMDSFKMNYTYALQPMLEVHLQSDLRYDADNNGSMASVWAFSAIGLIVLLLACINYMNLATAGSLHRAKETGIRKVNGAYKGQLIGQYLAESLLTSGMATALGTGLFLLLLPGFEKLTGATFDVGFSMPLLGILAIFAGIIGLLAGLYPAFVLSAFQPLGILKGVYSHAPKGIWLRKALVIFQFSATVALLSGVFIVWQQMNFIRQKSLGYNREAVIEVDYFGAAEVNKRFSALRDELLQSPAIQQVAYHGANVVGGMGNGWTTTEDNAGRETSSSLYQMEVSPDYFKTYGMQLAAGRFFDPAIPTDTAKAVLVNEAAVKAFGWNDPEKAIGKRFGKGARTQYVIGVVKDFHFESLHKSVEPILIHFSRGGNMLSLKTTAGQSGEAIRQLEKTWRTLLPEVPLEYGFVDDKVAKQYASEQTMQRLFLLLTGLSLLIACLGLFGLSIFMATQRVKEIGIRKVLGASVTNVIGLLSREFLLLVGVAIVIAAPLAWLGMQRWLGDFAYRVEIHWWVFALAGMVAVAIAFLTVSFQSIKAALANPVKSLRSE